MGKKVEVHAIQKQGEEGGGSCYTKGR